MIISHRHKYIFIHCRKAAGSSICVSLARSLGPSDLQLSAISETLANGISLTERVQREAMQSSRALALKSLFRDKKKRGPLIARALKGRYASLLGSIPQHAPAEAIKNAFPEEWAAYSKFCVVRNPWDKTVSDYFWRVRNIADPPSFSDYVEALANGIDLGGIVPVSVHSNWAMYTLDDQIAVDHIVRFENLTTELESVCSKIGIPWDGWLPRARSAFREGKAERQPYRELYSAETRDAVGSLYREEIDAFGYAF